jgi:hypothetical protein
MNVYNYYSLYPYLLASMPVFTWLVFNENTSNPMAAQKNIHGILGLLILLISHVLLFMNVEPVASWFYYWAWWSYILIVDSLIYTIKKNSLIMNRKGEFFLMLFWSIVIWTFFEAANLIMQNWYYSNVVPSRVIRWLCYGVAYATVLPGLFETTELLESIGLFKNSSVKPIAVTTTVQTGLVALGIASLLGVLFYPHYCFPLVWGSIIFLFEPINYRWSNKSLLKGWEKGTARKLCLLATAGFICGILWEFWNFWATTKWIYTVPFFEERKVFEMPLLGFVGFPPFAVECYVVYNFISLFRHQRGWEEDTYRLNQGKRVLFPIVVITSLVGLLFCLATFNAMDKKTVNSYRSSIGALEIVPPEITVRLEKLGIKTAQALLTQTGSTQGRHELALMLNVSDGEIVQWMKTAALSRLKGMGTVNTNLLNKAGIEDIPSLAKQDPATLYAKLVSLTHGETLSAPREAIIRVWVKEAVHRGGNH